MNDKIIFLNTKFSIWQYKKPLEWPRTNMEFEFEKVNDLL